MKPGSDRRRALLAGFALAVAKPVTALTLAKAIGELQVKFAADVHQLSAAQRATLMALLPKIKMLSLENIAIEACFAQPPTPRLPTEALARNRAAAIAEVFRRAGIPANRVLVLTRPVNTATASAAPALDVVEVNWAGQCLPGHPSCQKEYFSGRESDDKSR